MCPGAEVPGHNASKLSAMSSVLGAWDVTVHRPSGPFPSWFEISNDLGEIVGRYVGIWGSSRPIPSIVIDGNRLSFALPPQYEGCKSDLRFELTIEGDYISGQAWIWEDEPYPVSGTRAPAMDRAAGTPGEPIDLIAAGLEGFTARWTDMAFNWSMENGILVNSAKGTDIVSIQKFTDFRLEAEYTYPEKSNSGIYLRGRYEFQILDDFGSEPSVGSSAAIYGFFAPNRNAIHPAEEWNHAVIELIGRKVTVELNGHLVVEDTIPGITGGALDSNEGEPGPILLQGDHGPVSFQKLLLTPFNP